MFCQTHIFLIFVLESHDMRYSLDHKSPVPLHAQAEAMLRQMIDDPEFQNGSFLPNEVDLAKKLGISRNTIRQALNKLVFEGLLVRKKGVGTRVADRSVNSKVSNWKSFTQEMETQDLIPETFMINVSWTRPISDVSHVFGIPAEKEILKLVRLRGVKGNPFVYFVSWFHPRVGLTGEEDFSRRLYDILEQDYSTIAKLSKEEIRACAADDFISGKLKVPLGFPVLVRKRVVFDPGGRPIEFNIGYYKSDSFVYSIESDR